MAAMLGLFFIFIPIFEKKRSPTPKEVGIGVVCIVVGSGLLVVHRTTRFS